MEHDQNRAIRCEEKAKRMENLLAELELYLDGIDLGRVDRRFLDRLLNELRRQLAEW